MGGIRSSTGELEQKQNNTETDLEEHIVREFDHLPSDIQRKKSFAFVVWPI